MAAEQQQPTPAGTLQAAQVLEGHQGTLWCCSWSPAGDLLATSGADRSIRIWAREQAAEAGDAAARWICAAVLDDSHQRTIRWLAWSPTGRHLASCSFDGTVLIWANRGGAFEVVTQLEGHENEVKGVAWSNDGSLLATCSRDKTAWIWSVGADLDCEVLSVLQSHSQDVKAVRWHPNADVLFTCSYDDTIKIWSDEEDDWYCQQTLTGQESTVWQLAFHKGGRWFVSSSDDRSLVLWKSTSSDPSGEWQIAQSIPEAHSRTVYSVDWSPFGLVASGGGDDTIVVYSAAEQTAEDGQPQQELRLERLAKQSSAHKGDVNCVAWHPKVPGLLASVGDDSVVRLWQCTE